MRRTIPKKMVSLAAAITVFGFVGACQAQISIGGPYGVNIGGGRGVHIGGPFGVNIGQGRGANFGGPYGAQFGGGDGARFGGPDGVQFGSGGPADVDGIEIGRGVPDTLPINPAQGEEISVTLTYPDDARGEFRIILNDQQISMRPGQTIELASGQTWIVRFQQSRRRGDLTYSLPPGNYQFREKRSGWDLFLVPATPSPIPAEQLPTPAQPPGER